MNLQHLPHISIALWSSNLDKSRSFGNIYQYEGWTLAQITRLIWPPPPDGPGFLPQIFILWATSISYIGVLLGRDLNWNLNCDWNLIYIFVGYCFGLCIRNVYSTPVVLMTYEVDPWVGKCYYVLNIHALNFDNIGFKRSVNNFEIKLC